MHLTSVSVADCSGVTLTGLKTLAASDTLKNISFSARGLTRDQIFDLLASFRNVARYEIFDSKLGADADDIVAQGAARHIQVVIQRDGIISE